MGCFKRTALKQVYYLGWNRSPSQVGSMRQALGPGALGKPRGSGWRGRWEGGSEWGTHVNPWLFHFNVWQNPPQIKKNKNTFQKKKIIMALLFNTLSRFVIAFLSRSKCLNFPAAVSILSDFQVQENKICHCFHFLCFNLPWSNGTRWHDLSCFCFLMLTFKSTFSTPLLHFHQEAL